MGTSIGRREYANLSTQKAASLASVTENENANSSEKVEVGNIHKISKWTKYRPDHWGEYLYYSSGISTYEVADNKGINESGTNATDVCLAKYSKAVSDEIKTVGACYTGVKRALWDSGVIKDYKDMPSGSAHNAIPYFEKNDNKFEKVDVKKEDLKSLPAGHIIVYTKDDMHGHIAITNGYGQEMSDCTDNMKWLEKAGEGAEYKVFKLKSDAWKYNKKTKKLDFVGVERFNTTPLKLTSYQSETPKTNSVEPVSKPLDEKLQQILAKYKIGDLQI